MKELCRVCGRVPFGDIVLLGSEEWRHDRCCIGSEEWALYYAGLPVESRTKLAELHRCFIGVSAFYS
jgi:hypothetical protein